MAFKDGAWSKKLFYPNLKPRLVKSSGHYSHEKRSSNPLKLNRLVMPAIPPELLEKLNWENWGVVEIAAVAVIPITYALYRYFYASLIEWRHKGIPHIPVRPIVGSITDAALVRKSIGEVYADIYNGQQRMRYVGFYRFMQPAILLRDPELIKKVIVTDFESFPSNEVKGDVQVDPMFGRHLFGLSGERWSRLRGSIGEGFTNDKLKEIYAFLPEVCNILKAYIDQNMRKGGGKWETDLMELSTNFTTTAMSTCALGNLIDSINNPNTDLRKMVRVLTEPTPKRVISQLIFLQVPWLAKLLKIPFVPTEVTAYFRKTVAQEIERRKKEEVNRNDYMHMLIRLWGEGRLSLEPKWKMKADAEKKKKVSKRQGDQSVKETCKDQGDGDGKPVKATDSQVNADEMDDITAVALAFVSDGTVTTATLLSFTLFELAHNPEIQQKVRNEVEQVLGRHKGEATYEALQEMKYLDMVMHETLRFYPPAPFMVRSCAKSYKLPNPYRNSDYGGLILDKGFPLVVPMYGIHMDNAFYPNAKDFDPNRFSKEEICARKHFTYYPYGEGPRICIGFRLGLLMAKSAIASLTQFFEFIPHEKTPRPVTFDPRYFITVSKGGLWTHVRSLPNMRWPH